MARLFSSVGLGARLRLSSKPQDSVGRTSFLIQSIIFVVRIRKFSGATGPIRSCANGQSELVANIEINFCDVIN